MLMIEELIQQYNPKTTEETKAALREIIQSIILIGLSRGGFFEKASFYGGTSLRIFYGLKRFSEDLDFTLNKKDDNFSLQSYIESIREVGQSYGFNFEISVKEKADPTPIESAFAKINTYETFISLKIDQSFTNLLHKNEVLKVKFEVDTNPPLGFNSEMVWIDSPEFAPVKVLDLPSLFAGKIHAVLCRRYKNNVKGRDYYDLLFFIKKHISPNLVYLKNKLIESKVINVDDDFNIESLKTLLKDRIKEVNFDMVKEDASKFIFKGESIDMYSLDLFNYMIDQIK